MRNLEQTFPDSRVLIRHKTHDAAIACHHEFDFPFPSDNGGCVLACDFSAHLQLLWYHRSLHPLESILLQPFGKFLWRIFSSACQEQDVMCACKEWNFPLLHSHALRVSLALLRLPRNNTGQLLTAIRCLCNPALWQLFFWTGVCVRVENNDDIRWRCCLLTLGFHSDTLLLLTYQCRHQFEPGTFVLVWRVQSSYHYRPHSSQYLLLEKKCLRQMWHASERPVAPAYKSVS